MYSGGALSHFLCNVHLVSSNGKDLNDMWASKDVELWEQMPAKGQLAPWSARHGHSTEVINGTAYLFGGMQGQPDGVLLNDLWSSPDGWTWTRLRPPTTATQPDFFLVRPRKPRTSHCNCLQLVSPTRGVTLVHSRATLWAPQVTRASCTCPVAAGRSLTRMAPLLMCGARRTAWTGCASRSTRHGPMNRVSP